MRELKADKRSILDEAKEARPGSIVHFLYFCSESELTFEQVCGTRYLINVFKLLIKAYLKEAIV